MENNDNKVLLKIHNDINFLKLTNFNLYDYKILFSICSQVLEKGTDQVVIPYSELREILNLNSTKTVTDNYLEELVFSTHHKQKQINFNINNRFYEGEASLFVNIFKNKSGEKNFYVTVNPVTKYYLNKLAREFTIANLKALNSLNSKYSYRLFLQLKQFAKGEKVRHNNKLCCWKNYKIEDFKKVMDIPASYRMSDIDKQVLNFSKKELKEHFEELTFEKVKKSGKVTNLIIYFKFKEKEDNFEIELLPNYNISKIEEYFSTTFLTMSYTNEIKNKLEKLELTHSFEILKNWLDETWLFVSENKGIINKEAYFANLIVNGVAPMTEKRKEELDKLENQNKELIEENQGLLYKNVFSSSEKIVEDIKELNNSKFNIKSMQEIAKKTEFQKTEEKEEIEISREEFNMLFEEFYKLKKKENKIEQDTEFLKNVLMGEFKHRYKYKIID